MLNIYHETIPDFVREFSAVSEVLRLKDVGMDCGLEYTSYKVWPNETPYKRYEHSLGVGLIVYHFTGSMKESVSALFHDIASPVFAHVVDFMNNDYLTQESTEEETRHIIENSKEIMSLLAKYHLTVEEVCDYHIYPVADNPTPKLSADRLEYTLVNMVRNGYCDREDIKRIYDDLTVGINEDGEKELMFRNKETAEYFVKGALLNSKVYVSDKDRYSMERLARLLRKALNNGVIEYSDLYTTEKQVIDKLTASSITEEDWNSFQKLSVLEKSFTQADDTWLKIEAKKRYIDPYVENEGRVSELSVETGKAIKEFVDSDFNYYVRGF